MNNLSLNAGGKLINLTSPCVMGILNITPDSFFDGGKFTETKAISKQAGKLLAEGAAIIDLGAQSTRPGAKMVAESTEIKRLLPAIDAIKKEYPDAVISVDTFRAEVAKQCIDHGASIINDVSGGELDRKMIPLAARLNVPYVLMHMKGSPATMQKNPTYRDVVAEVSSRLLKKLCRLRKMGVHDIIIDPGFGFGKTTEHNYQLLNALHAFTAWGHPVMAGISRKSMICKVLGVSPQHALNGTTAVHMAALMQGASLLRVHDVKEAVETIKLFEQIRHPGKNMTS